MEYFAAFKNMELGLFDILGRMSMLLSEKIKFWGGVHDLSPF